MENMFNWFFIIHKLGNQDHISGIEDYFSELSMSNFIDNLNQAIDKNKNKYRLDTYYGVCSLCRDIEKIVEKEIEEYNAQNIFFNYLWLDYSVVAELHNKIARAYNDIDEKTKEGIDTVFQEFLEQGANSGYCIGIILDSINKGTPIAEHFYLKK